MIGTQKKACAFLQVTAIILTTTLILATPAMAKKKDPPPQTTTDGLTLAKSTKHRLVYLADDVDFGIYNKVMIVECAVAFAKNWQRDYNRQERDLSRKVSDKDVERIKDKLSAEFKKVFTETMTDNGIEVVTEAGPDVIILRPAIFNLVVTAPNISSPGRTRTYTADPGQMTLYLELYDSVSSAILAKAMDAQDAGRAAPTMSYSTGVNNIAAADRVLKRWANEIAGHFGATTNPNYVDAPKADDKTDAEE